MIMLIYLSFTYLFSAEVLWNIFHIPLITAFNHFKLHTLKITNNKKKNYSTLRKCTDEFLLFNCLLNNT